MMVWKKNIVTVLISLLFITFLQQYAKGQDTKEITPILQKNTEKEDEAVVTRDTVPVVLDETELNRLTDILGILNKQNQSYTSPFQPSMDLLRFLEKDDSLLPEEAMYWVNYVRDASEVFGDNVTFRDTVIADPLFMPLLFKGVHIPESTVDYKLPWAEPENAYTKLYTPDTTMFWQQRERKRYRDMADRYLRMNHPDYFKYTIWDLPADVPKPEEIKIEPMIEPFAISVELNDSTAPQKYKPKIRYWKTYFESSLQIYQNHITANWHKGGAGSIINLFMRNYGRFNYDKNKVKYSAELDWRESFYNAPNDTIRSYKIGEDLLRFYTTFGYQAFNNKFYYTFTGEFKTQIFPNFAENTKRKMAAFLAPLNINVGLGMMYNLNKNFKKPNRSLSLSINFAPLSCNYMYSRTERIDLGRHGFRDGKRYLKKFGSSLYVNGTFNLNKITRWTTRFQYITSYERVEWELENTINITINRFLSATFNLNMRYDDGVNKREDYDHYLQIYEKLTFGFAYKW